MLSTHPTTTRPRAVQCKEHISSFVQPNDAEKPRGQGEGEGSCFYFGKSKLPKGLCPTLHAVLGCLPFTMFVSWNKIESRARERIQLPVLQQGTGQC